MTQTSDRRIRPVTTVVDGWNDVAPGLLSACGIIVPDSMLDGSPVVYFVHFRTIQKIKIGYTQQLRVRMNSLAMQYRQPLDLVALEPGGERREYELHTRFAALRQGRTELFDLGLDLVSYVRASPLFTLGQALALL